MKLLHDTPLRLFGPLILLFCALLLQPHEKYVTDTWPMIQQTLIPGFIGGYVCWEVARWVIKRIQARFPGTQRTRRRLLLVGLLLPVLALFGLGFRLGLLSLLAGEWIEYANASVFAQSFGLQLFYHLIYVAVYEGVYLYDQLEQSYAEKEMLLKAQWQSRFDALKGQVNPHFLFNSLNSLSSLIQEEPDRAEVFVDEMSKVYRYLLQSNDRELTTLEAELRFIHSYAHLLMTRHGNGISVEIDVEEGFRGYQLPPLTLQLLVENAVKHNVILSSRPLRVEIRTTETGTLVVRNNLQPKTQRVASNQVGLANIAARYRLLTQAEVEIENGPSHFTVTLPLLNQSSL